MLDAGKNDEYMFSLKKKKKTKETRLKYFQGSVTVLVV